jgi:AcrR family transcriptional regulator
VAARAVRNKGLVAGESAVYLPSVKDKIDNRRPRTSNEDSDQGRTWQERAIERRLGDARALAVARSTRFMATALELVQESGQASFTLQTLADRANLSVRTFYQHFAGKDELLLALYEDLTAQFTEAIREKVEAAEGPMGQLEAWCRGVLSRPGSSQEVGGRLVLIYNLSLELDNPEAFAKVWEPHRKLLTEILTACSQAGLIRNDLTVKQLTSLLGSTLTSLGQYNALHGGMDETGLTEEVVWSWCRRAVLPAAAPCADDSAAGKQSTIN